MIAKVVLCLSLVMFSFMSTKSIACDTRHVSNHPVKQVDVAENDQEIRKKKTVSEPASSTDGSNQKSEKDE